MDTYLKLVVDFSKLYQVRQWSGHRMEPRLFSGYLNEFMDIGCYRSVTDFYEQHESYLAEGMTDARTDLEELVGDEPFVYGYSHEAAETGNGEPVVSRISQVATSEDLIDFLNTVLRGNGFVTHPQGARPEYEIVSEMV